MTLREARRLTPIQKIGPWYLKREDLFAPPEWSGVNGSKLRQCIYLVETAQLRGYKAIVTGASIISPQLAMTSIVGSAYRMPVCCVIARNSNRESRSVRLAAQWGAVFETAAVGYNMVLQARVREIATADPRVFPLPYGISCPPHWDFERFHFLTGQQVRNLPDGLPLYLTLGSGNSAASVLYGLHILNKKPESVTLFNIGPSKASWLWQRLADMNVTRDMLPPIRVVDLYDEMPYHKRVAKRWGDVVFHPHYEGKMIEAIEREDMQPGVIWVVGAELP